MHNRKWLLLFTVLVVAFFVALAAGSSTDWEWSLGGTDEETEEPAAEDEDAEVDREEAASDAQIQTGLEIDDELAVLSPQSAFAPNEDFWVSYESNASFGTDQVTVLIEDNADGETILQDKQEVEPDWNVLAVSVWISDPGQYTISVMDADRVLANHQVVIQ